MANEVVQVATPPVNGWAAQAGIVVVLSRNATVPVGVSVVPDGLTVAVKVTCCPTQAAQFASLVMAVVVS